MEPQTPGRGTRRASSGDAPSTHREDTWLGLGTFRRAFSQASKQASGRPYSRFLFRSFRRAVDDSPAADQCQATAVPGAGQGPEVPPRFVDRVSQQRSTGVVPEEPEPEAGEGFTTLSTGGN